MKECANLRKIPGKHRCIKPEGNGSCPRLRVKKWKKKSSGEGIEPGEVYCFFWWQEKDIVQRQALLGKQQPKV